MTPRYSWLAIPGTEVYPYPVDYPLAMVAGAVDDPGKRVRCVMWTARSDLMYVRFGTWCGLTWTQEEAQRRLWVALEKGYGGPGVAEDWMLRYRAQGGP